MRSGLTPIQWLMVVITGLLLAGVVMYGVYSGAVGGLEDIFNRSAGEGAGNQDRLDDPFDSNETSGSISPAPVPVRTAVDNLPEVA